MILLVLYYSLLSFILPHVQFINLGVKCFSNAPSPLVPDCDFRLSQEVGWAQVFKAGLKSSRLGSILQDWAQFLKAGLSLQGWAQVFKAGLKSSKSTL